MNTQLSVFMAGAALVGSTIVGASFSFADGRSLHPIDNHHLVHYEADGEAKLINVGEDGQLETTPLGLRNVQQVSSTPTGWVSACSAVGNEVAVFHQDQPEAVHRIPLEFRKIEGYLAELDALLEEGQVPETELEKHYTMEHMTVQHDREVSDCAGLHLVDEGGSQLSLYIASLAPSNLQKVSLQLSHEDGARLKVERLFERNYNGVRSIVKAGDKLVGLSSEVHGNSWIWVIDEASEEVLGGNTEANTPANWVGKDWSTSLSTGIAEDNGRFYFVDKYSGKVMSVDSTVTIDDRQAAWTEVGPQRLYGVAAAAGNVVTLGENASGEHFLTRFKQTDAGLVKVGSETMNESLQDVAVTPDGSVFVASRRAVFRISAATGLQHTEQEERP